MAWLAVDKDGTEVIFDDCPERDAIELHDYFQQGFDYETLRKTVKLYMWSGGKNVIELPKGTIEKIIGKKLTWEDEPVELKL